MSFLRTNQSKGEVSSRRTVVPVVVRRGNKSQLLSNQRISVRSQRKIRSGGSVLNLLGQLLVTVAGSLVVVAQVVARGTLVALRAAWRVARPLPGLLVVGGGVLVVAVVAGGKKVYSTILEWCTFSPSRSTHYAGERAEPKLHDDLDDDSAVRLEPRLDDDRTVSVDDSFINRNQNVHVVHHLDEESEPWDSDIGPWTIVLERRGGQTEGASWQDLEGDSVSELSKAFENAKVASLDAEEKYLPDEALTDQAAALRTIFHHKESDKF